MIRTLFIADLHLSPERPAITHLFLNFLEEQAGRGGDLYILGDLFDAWIGDDNPLPEVQAIFSALKNATSGGLKISVMHGNRDFLLGEEFEEITGCEIIPDPSLIEINGTTALLMHGDLLCTDDTEYLQARQLLRNPEFIADFLSKSIPERIALAAEYRKKSGEVISLKSADIMDVNQQAVEKALREQGSRLLIHGHTHRPNHHQFDLDGKQAERYVLQDWKEDRGGYLLAENGTICNYLIS